MNYIEKISYALMIGLFFIVMSFNLLSILLAGTISYIVINKIYININYHVSNKFVNTFLNKGSLVLLLAIIIFLLGVIFYSITQFDNDNVKLMLSYVFETLQEIKKYIPLYLSELIPTTIDSLKKETIDILQDNTAHIFEITKQSVSFIIHVLIGVLLACLVVIDKSHNQNKKTGLKEELSKRLLVYKSVFEKILTAQVKISSINTILTSVYLLIVIPLVFHIHLPYVGTIVVLTFLFGLIPVIGNLITNVIIVVVSLSASLWLAILSLLYLIIIHKLEYYFNAKIIGGKIETSIWELLIVMIVFESIWGIGGVIVSPFVYGYIKEEMKLKNLI